MKHSWLVAALSLACLPLSAQFYPQGSQVTSYFPHLAVGGPSGARWTTSLTFVNAHQSAGANAVAYFFDDSGSPLALDFGTGPAPTLSFAVPAQGSVTLTSTSSSSTTVGGWAVVTSGLPRREFFNMACRRAVSRSRAYPYKLRRLRAGSDRQLPRILALLLAIPTPRQSR